MIKRDKMVTREFIVSMVTFLSIAFGIVSLYYAIDLKEQAKTYIVEIPCASESTTITKSNIVGYEIKKVWEPLIKTRCNANLTTTTRCFDSLKECETSDVGIAVCYLDFRTCSLKGDMPLVLYLPDIVKRVFYLYVFSLQVFTIFFHIIVCL
jgi:hypothetical protein